MRAEIISLLTEIRDELKKLNEKQPKAKTRRESVMSDELPIIARLWNEWVDPCLAAVVSMETGSTRYKNCLDRWKAKPNEEYWIKVITRMNESSFCKGRSDGDRKWKADIEFLCRPDTHARILEGKYDDEVAKSALNPPKFLFNEVTGNWEQNR